MTFLQKLIIITYLYFVSLFVYLFIGGCKPRDIRGRQRTSWGSWFSPMLSSRLRTQVVTLGSRCLLASVSTHQLWEVTVSSQRKCSTVKLFCFFFSFPGEAKEYPPFIFQM